MTKQFSIFQINDANENARYIKYSGLDIIKRMKLSLSIDLYNKVYDGEILTDKSKDEYILDDIYTIFNIGRPSDFQGHSLSTSDIVMMDGKYFYCDSYGWEQVNL